MKKIILTSFLAFVLLLAACGTGNDNADDSEQATEENPATETEQPVADDTEEPDDSNPAGDTEEEPSDSEDGSSEEDPAADSDTPDESTGSTEDADDTDAADDAEDSPAAEKVTAAFNGMSDTHSMEVKMEDGSLAVINFHEEDAEVVNELQEGAKIKYVPVTEDSGMEYATELEVIE